MKEKIVEKLEKVKENMTEDERDLYNKAKSKTPLSTEDERELTDMSEKLTILNEA